MTHAELLRSHANLAIKEGGMYYSGEYLSGIATVVENLESENAKLRKQVRKLVPELCEQNAALCQENAKLRELACHLWYVKPRDVTSVLVEGKLVDLEELMEGVGLRWENA
jgi:hypothetical protein